MQGRPGQPTPMGATPDPAGTETYTENPNSEKGAPTMATPTMDVMTAIKIGQLQNVTSTLCPAT
jgi:hypothetical protein